jgi:dTMP kinase
LALFVTLEGGEGSGKSTQAKALWNKLHRRNIAAVLTHEPGGTSLGNDVGRLLKWEKENSISAQAETLLFAACRAELGAEVILPALEEGKVVICDRFSHSTCAYQGYGRGLDLDFIETINSWATQNVKPDLIILLDSPPEEGLARKRRLRDRFELEGLAFHRRVRQGYLNMAAAEPDRWLVIDAMLPKRKVSRLIWEKVSSLLQGNE